MRIPLPGWVLLLSVLGFLATWMVAPGESLSGRAHLPRRPAARAPFDSAAQAVPAPAAEPPPPTRPLFAMSPPYQIALTYDDGPHHVHTAQLLDVLAAHRVQATFFVNGCWLEPGYAHARENREVLAEAFRRGHAVGNHAFHHVNLGRLPHEKVEHEIVTNEQIIEGVIGVRPYLMRPPYGVLTRYEADLLRERDYVIVRWNAAVEDEEHSDPEEIEAGVLLWLRHYEGGIVMLHDRNAATVEATELILRGIDRENARRAARGQPVFRVVPLDSFPQAPAESGDFLSHGD